jgi:hypothetical protein
MPETSLPVEYLFTVTGTVGRGTTIKGGPMGARSTAFSSMMASRTSAPRVRPLAIVDSETPGEGSRRD